MKINKFTNGPFSVNTYLLEINNSGIVIDPGHDISKMMEYVGKHQLIISHILITHGHIDHIAGINHIRKIFPAACSMANPVDNNLINMAEDQSRLFGLPESGIIKIDENLPQSGTITPGPFEVEIFSVPGHSQGSLCFKFYDSVFTGDTLFAGSVGRSDLFDGNHNQLIKSIKEKLFTLEDDVIIYPGHGESSTIGIEKKHNPYF